MVQSWRLCEDLGFREIVLFVGLVEFTVVVWVLDFQGLGCVQGSTRGGLEVYSGELWGFSFTSGAG